MKQIYLILTGISLILLSSCTQRTQKAKGYQTVKIDTIVSADKQTFLQFPGKVKAAQDISLAFRVSGTISKIHVKDGTRVQEGQLLAELDPTDYQVQLDATEAEYQQIKAEAERVMALYKDNGTTPNANDKAVYGLKQITAKYKHHKDQLAYTRLYAPFNGYVQKRLFEAHETIGAGMPVLSMISSGTPEVEINLPAAEYIRRDQFDNYHCTFDIYPGETYGLVGESGSGKSVFTKSFMGLLDANGSITSGTIDYYGADDGKPIRLSDLKKEKDWLKVRGHEIAMIMQDPMTSLNPLKTIGDQIMEAVELHQGLKGAAAREKTLEYLRDVGIADPEVRFKQYPHEFSGGMRQRVVIAIAVACNPQILICDEPTTALDVTIQAQILELLKEMRVKYNLTIILITHDLGVVANIADRVAVMYAGDIVEIGTSDEIYYDPRHPYTWALLQALPQLGTKGEALPTIDGTPPNLFNEIKGDAFAPRNKHALAIDFVAEPPFFQVSETHAAKTWYLDPRAPKMERPHSIQNLREKMGKMGGSNLNG